VRFVEAGSAPEKKTRLRQAGQACREAVRHGRKLRVFLPEALRWQGVCLFLKGNRSAARRAWQRSLDIADAAGQRYDLAMTHLEMGRRLGEPEHLSQAGELFSEMDIDPRNL
jgi:hypothetical protein